GSLTWAKLPKVSVATYEATNSAGALVSVPAHKQVSNATEQANAIAEIQAAFPDAPVCVDSYEYEVGCIEVREGHQMVTDGTYQRTHFTRLPMDSAVLSAMVQAANVGENMEKMFAHELYYRTKGKEGHRLALTELQQTYDNLSVWLWNNEAYRYDASIADELGFETAVGYLNCYSNDQHGGAALCPSELRTTLEGKGFLAANGELNPSYPLNYQEKPLTRLMLGRSYWDQEIKVDTTAYPGRPQGSATTGAVSLKTYHKPVAGTVSNMQSTGFWAPQHGSVTLSGGAKATVSVALIDDLTGREQHETALKRPPRVQKNFTYDGQSLTFSVPYGGLIYITPVAQSTDVNAEATYQLSGVL
ncbi:MAG: M60 family peptidase N-terminal accessory domain-containing protein, partial [Shewanella sp.]